MARDDNSPGNALPEGQHADDIVFPSTIPFLLVHLSLIGIFWTGVSASMLWLCFALYAIRMFFVTAGYHRYFSHRTYKTSRFGQFLLALGCQSTAQRGILWWAAEHRHHHKYSDTPQDVHSPGLRGFWYSHMGWIFSRQESAADESLIPDLMKYPELRWLNRDYYLTATALGFGVWLIWGWQGLFVGFLLSTVILYHSTFMINSLAHVSGRQRYVTGDDSRNNWFLALLTLGEGWHNNHHYYQTSTRQGFRWWEIDITYYTLRVLSWFRVVWDLRTPPKDVVRAERPIGNTVLDRAAERLAESVNLDAIADRLRTRWAALEASSAEAKRRISALPDAIMELCRKELPSVEELRAKARTMMPAKTPHLDTIAERGRQLILERLSHRLLGDPIVGAVPAS